MKNYFPGGGFKQRGLTELTPSPLFSDGTHSAKIVLDRYQDLTIMLCESEKIRDVFQCFTS